MSKVSKTPEFVRQVFTHTDKSSDLDIQFLARNQRELEQYTKLSDREIETQEWIKNFANSGTFLDIGANIGLFSLMASRYKPEMKVLAVEPHIPSFETLFQNIKLNACANVHPLNAAFAERTEVGIFNYMKVESGTAKSVFGNSIDFQGRSFAPQYACSSISYSADDFFRCFELEYPNYVKIDVDGIEISVLKGMGNILMSKNLQSIMIEANSRIMEVEIRRILSHYGFKIDRVQNKSWETAKTRNNFFIK